MMSKQNRHVPFVWTADEAIYFQLFISTYQQHENETEYKTTKFPRGFSP